MWIPTNCPACDSKLERVKDQLFCKSTDCDVQTSKNLLHFIQVMGIKGLGEKTLEKLEITSINELYNLSLEGVQNRLGSEKIASKLLNEIALSQNTPLKTFIQSFGITLIGNSASTKLAKVTDSLWDISKETCERAGLGEKATNYLLQWINKNMDKYYDLPIVTSTNLTNEVEELYKVVITGKLNDYSSRAKAKDFLETKGVSVLSSVSSKVKYLICDNVSNSSSCTKAKKLNIPILSMNDLLNIINGDIND